MASAHPGVQAAGRRTHEIVMHVLARELKVERKLLYTWKYQFEGRPEPRHANLAATAEERRDKQLRDEITKLKSALAELSLCRGHISPYKFLPIYCPQKFRAGPDA